MGEDLIPEPMRLQMLARHRDHPTNSLIKAVNIRQPVGNQAGQPTANQNSPQPEHYTGFGYGDALRAENARENNSFNALINGAEHMVKSALFPETPASAISQLLSISPVGKHNLAEARSIIERMEQLINSDKDKEAVSAGTLNTQIKRGLGHGRTPITGFNKIQQQNIETRASKMFDEIFLESDDMSEAERREFYELKTRFFRILTYDPTQLR